MKKQIISLAAAAAIFCTPLAFADFGNGGSPGAAAPGLTLSDLATQNTPTVDVQLKTTGGKTIRATVNPKDLQGLNDGDKVQLFATPAGAGAMDPAP